MYLGRWMVLAFSKLKIYKCGKPMQTKTRERPSSSAQSVCVVDIYIYKKKKKIHVCTDQNNQKMA